MPRRGKIEQMLVHEPDDPFLNFSLAMELVKEGTTDLALERFDRVMTLDATYSAAHYHKGNTLIGLGRLDEARATLERGLEVTEQAGDDHAHREMQELLATIAG